MSETGGIVEALHWRWSTWGLRSTATDWSYALGRRESQLTTTLLDIRVATAVIYAYHLAGGAMTTSYQLAGNLQMPDGWEECDIDAIAPGLPSDDGGESGNGCRGRTGAETEEEQGAGASAGS